MYYQFTAIYKLIISLNVSHFGINRAAVMPKTKEHSEDLLITDAQKEGKGYKQLPSKLKCQFQPCKVLPRNSKSLTLQKLSKDKVRRQQCQLCSPERFNNKSRSVQELLQARPFWQNWALLVWINQGRHSSRHYIKVASIDVDWEKHLSFVWNCI